MERARTILEHFSRCSPDKNNCVPRVELTKFLANFVASPSRIVEVLARNGVVYDEVPFIRFWRVVEEVVESDSEREPPESIRCMLLFRDALLSLSGETASTEQLRSIVLSIKNETIEKEYWQSVLDSLEKGEGSSKHHISSLSRGVFIWLKSFVSETTRRRTVDNSVSLPAIQPRRSLPDLSAALPSSLPALPARSTKYVVATELVNSGSPPASVSESNPAPPSETSLLISSLRQRIRELENLLAQKSEKAELWEKRAIRAEAARDAIHERLSKETKYLSEYVASFSALAKEGDEINTCLLGRIERGGAVTPKNSEPANGLGSFWGILGGSSAKLESADVPPSPPPLPPSAPVPAYSAASAALIDNLQFEVTSLRSQLLTLEAQKSDADMELTRLKGLRVTSKSSSTPTSGGLNLQPSISPQIPPPLPPSINLPAPSESGLTIGGGPSVEFFSSDKRISGIRRKSTRDHPSPGEIAASCNQQ